MRLAGHTLGTPEHTLEQSFELFRSRGLTAAEVVWQDGYPPAISESGGLDEAREARELADRHGIAIACLTPYMSAINSLDEAERDVDIDRFRRCIAAAEVVGAPWVRVYAGTHQPHERDLHAPRWERLVDALRNLGAEAHDRGTTLCVENHFSTMAVTARETKDLMEAVDSPGVGIVYDQANLTFTHSEGYEEAIKLQFPWIRHVQIKDLVFVDPDRQFSASAVANVSAEERAVRSRVVGEGIIDWPGILARLHQRGYDGFLSLEYETRWHPQDLPEPAESFRRGADEVRRILGELGVDAA